MAERLALVTQPQKDNNPKVWNDGRWTDAAATHIVVTDANGKILEGQLPEAALTANVPDWEQTRSWIKDDLCYRDSKVYRANGDLPTNTPFVVGTLATNWSELTTATVVPNVPDWDDYNPFLDKVILKGDLFYYRTDLYRASIASTGKSIVENNYFTKLTGFKQAPNFTSALSYSKNEIVLYAGVLAQANAEIVAGTSFAWGIGDTATFRPVLSSGRVQFTWRGVVPGTNTNYGFGSVIALNDVDSTLYVNITNGDITLNAANTIKLDRSRWIPLIGGVPAYAMLDYMARGDDLILTGFDINKNYDSGVLVIYGSSENVWVSIKKVTAGSIFNAGKEWVRVNDISIPTVTKADRLSKSYVAPVLGMKEYYDSTLKISMLHRSIPSTTDSAWAQHDGLKEGISFPQNPTNNQVFTSTLKTTYVYDSANAYWKLASTGGSAIARSVMLATRNVEQTSMSTNSTWSLDTTNRVVGDNITRNGATITLREKRSYKITFKIEPASLASGNWVRYGIYNVTTSSWQANQSYASHWQGNSSGTSGYGPNGTGIVYIDTTVQTDIQMRCNYAGSAHNIRGSLDTSQDAGDSYILIEEVAGDEVLDQRNTVILSGDRTDYLMAKLSTSYSAPGNSTQYDLPFNLNVISIGEVANNNGVFRLKANKTYELSCDVFTSVGGSGRFAYAWHDANNVRLPGTVGAKVAPTTTESFAPQNIARTVITPSVDTDVKIRVTYDTGGGHTIYVDDNSLGSSYVIIRQLGSSKVTTNEVVVSPNDPKNYWTRDVINNTYDVSKHLTDWYFATFVNDLPASAVALKVGESAAEKQARAWYLLQKFNTYLCGTIDNDQTFDGLLGEAGRVMNTVPAMMNAGRYSSNSINGMAISDVDPVLTWGTANTTTITGTATEYFKLCLGRDNANNIHWITVCPVQYWDTTAQRVIPSLMIGLAFWNGSAWSITGGGGAIPVYSASSMVGAGTATQSNNIVAGGGAPLVQYLPHRLELA